MYLVKKQYNWPSATLIYNSPRVWSGAAEEQTKQIV